MASGAQARNPQNVFGYVWRVSRRQQILLILLTLIVVPLTMAPLELQRRIVNEAIGGRNLHWLLILGGVYLAVVLLQGALKLGLQFWRAKVGEAAVRRMRRRIIDQQLRRARAGEDLGGFGGGQVIPMLAAEVERVGGFIAASLSEPALQGGTLIAVFGYMLYIEPQIALVSLAFFLPQMIAVPLIQHLMNRRARAKVTLVRELGERISDRTVCVERCEEHDDFVSRIYANRIGYFRLKFVLKFLVNLFSHLAPLSVLVFGGWLAIRGESEVGTLVAFISGFERMSDPARQLLAHYRLASESQVKYRLLADRLQL